MHPHTPRAARLLVAAGLLSALLAAPGSSPQPAAAAPLAYAALLSGPAESPPSGSPGTGVALVDLDTAAHTLRVRVTFTGLTAGTSASHIHAPTAAPDSGTAGVATSTPSFPGFPLGVTSGSYDQTFNTLDAATWNPAYITANASTPAGAEAALATALNAGEAYLNVHTTANPSGEIRGFLHPQPLTFSTTLSGPAESPPNASPGTGVAQVDFDAAAHTMRVRVTFSGLTAGTSASHIHAPTTVPDSGTAGVATALPTFPSFPLGVTSSSYDQTFNTLATATWNPAYVTANGGTTAGAEAAFLLSLVGGRAYLNVHTTAFPSGEIRGFLHPGALACDAGKGGFEYCGF